MLVGQFKRHPGVKAPIGGPVLPRVSIDTLDRTLLSLVDAQGEYLLEYDVRPNELAPSQSTTLTGKDRVSGKTIVQTRTAGVITPSDARFNGQPVIEFGTGSGSTLNFSSDLRIDAPPPLGSFTGFIVAAIAPSLKATPALSRLISITKGSTSVAYLLFQSTGNILWGNSASSSQSAVIQAVNVPGGDVPFLITFSYNAVTNKVRIYLNGVLMSEATATVPFDIDSTCKIGIGGVAGQSTGVGWVGPIARLPMFRSELSAAQVAFIANPIKAKYGIA